MPVELLRNCLDAADKAYLQGLLDGACDLPPSGWRHWFLAGSSRPLGVLDPDHAAVLTKALPPDVPLVDQAHGWVWHADFLTAEIRSGLLQSVAADLRDAGHISGWRKEDYACWGHLNAAWPYTDAPFFELERAAYRYFGLRSHACHVHGITPDGRMWCGRRAHSKATDPGMLDNLAAGGMPIGEDPLQCALREVAEEAGLRCLPADLESCLHTVVTERREQEGWHSERLFIYTLPLQLGVYPENRDGEVSGFMCLTLSEVLRLMRSGEFTRDAACAIAALLLPVQQHSLR